MAVSIRLDPQIEHRLDNLAHLTGRGKAYYLREFIVASLDDLDDFYVADPTTELVRKGQETIVGSAEVRSSLGLGL